MVMAIPTEYNDNHMYLRIMEFDKEEAKRIVDFCHLGEDEAVHRYRLVKPILEPDSDYRNLIF